PRARRQPRGVEAQDHAPEAHGVLGPAETVVLAEARIELRVRTEAQGAPVVIRLEVWDVGQDVVARTRVRREAAVAREGEVAGEGEARNAVGLGYRAAVIDVDVGASRPAGVDRDPEQAALQVCRAHVR